MLHARAYNGNGDEGSIKKEIKELEKERNNSSQAKCKIPVIFAFELVYYLVDKTKDYKSKNTFFDKFIFKHFFHFYFLSLITNNYENKTSQLFHARKKRILRGVVIMRSYERGRFHAAPHELAGVSVVAIMQHRLKAQA